MGLDLLPAGGGRVLEVGVGSGVLVPTLTARYRDYTGTDLTLAPGLRRRWSPPAAPPSSCAPICCRTICPANHYDAIVCFSVLEHIADSRGAARGLARVARARRHAGLRLSDGQRADVARVLADRLQGHRRPSRQPAREDPAPRWPKC